MEAAKFQSRVLSWFENNGRKNLPWQTDKSPYRVWISEIMLQQTQVATVIPYFNEFTRQFPDIAMLAKAPLDEVLHYWSGLGYYARARNIHKTAQLIHTQGHFPESLSELMALPGIGRSTAAAILSIAFNQSHAILDGNVKRVLSRFKGIAGWPGASKVSKQLWALSEAYTPVKRVADYTQAMMDLGATLCKRSRPDCGHCPLSSDCIAFLQQRTDQLPTSKPKTKLPIKYKTLLLLQNPAQQFLLHKRPLIGIWGGLWSLPEFADCEQANSWCQQHYLPLGESLALPIRRHTFSHFHLDYQPVIIKIGYPGKVIMDDQQTAWYNVINKDKLGLPAPVKQLLQQIETQQFQKTIGENI
jgi:A/G-specific adenine glycosylase